MKSKKFLIIGVILAISIIASIVIIVTINSNRVGDLGEDIEKEGTVKDISTMTSTNHKTTKVRDSLGNTITVPKGFVVVNPDDTVQDGIVISDMEGDDLNNKNGSGGNQFVWIPVGKVIKKDKSEVTIELGRYTFNGDNGEPTLVQSASNYEGETGLKYLGNFYGVEFYYKELKTVRNGNSANDNRAENATAKDLAGFVKSVQDNGGYYLARYEASNNGGKIESKYNKEVWKSYQREASLVARTMYDDTDKNIGVKSDLVNSYAWDTAIVYIQEMANSNYANIDNRWLEIQRTGKSGDEECKINDMSANVGEWSTECTTIVHSSGVYPCVFRGFLGTGNREYCGVDDSGRGTRTLLYVK